MNKISLKLKKRTRSWKSNKMSSVWTQALWLVRRTMDNSLTLASQRLLCPATESWQRKESVEGDCLVSKSYPWESQKWLRRNICDPQLTFGRPHFFVIWAFKMIMTRKVWKCDVLKIGEIKRDKVWTKLTKVILFCFSWLNFVPFSWLLPSPSNHIQLNRTF